jgi:hypothetical protein
MSVCLHVCMSACLHVYPSVHVICVCRHSFSLSHPSLPLSLSLAAGGSYASVEAYYNDISPVHSAHLIHTPTLSLTAMDGMCTHTYTYTYTYTYTHTYTYTPPPSPSRPWTVCAIFPPHFPLICLSFNAVLLLYICLLILFSTLSLTSMDGKCDTSRHFPLHTHTYIHTYICLLITPYTLPYYIYTRYVF